jgi:signal transduction histidine kinase
MTAPKPDTFAQLLSLLAHDLRNPLSALQSNLTYLDSLLVDASTDAREAFADAQVSCDGLNALIDSVELLAQVVAEPRSYDVAPCDFAGAVAEALSRCAALGRSYEVLLAPPPPSTPMLALAHREMLVRAVVYVITNAIQHSPAGGTVRLALEPGTEQLRLIVIDQGDRLNPELEEVAFTPEGQIHSKATRGGRYSRGLGLLCARVCARATGAALVVADVEGATNAFSLAVPRAG